MATSVEQLEQWIASPREDEHLEFKKAENQFDSRKLCRYCVAIANEGGGKLILGVTDSRPRRVVGTNAFLNHSEVASKLLDSIRLRVTVEAVEHPDGRIVIFHIPSRPSGTACEYEGAYWMRSGEDLRPMTEDRLRLIFDEGKPDWESRVAMEGCSPESVAQLLETPVYFQLMQIPEPDTRAGVLDRFLRERLLERDGSAFSITNLGAILFAKDLSRFDGLGRKAVRIVAYSGSGKLSTRFDRILPTGYAAGFEGLIQLVNALLPSNEVIEQALRRQTQAYPEIAVRELVANAVIHQDFRETGTSTMIEIYSDRIEISSPGQPFIEPDRFIDEYQSRNERLADLMRRLRICEEKGSGIDKVIQAAEVTQLPAPEFRTGIKRTVSILYAPVPFEQLDREGRIQACYQHCVLRYIMNEKMGNQSLRQRFDLPSQKANTVSNIISATVEAGLIRIDDSSALSKRYARYVPYWA